jgi:hypothetical protein
VGRIEHTLLDAGDSQLIRPKTTACKRHLTTEKVTSISLLLHTSGHFCALDKRAGRGILSGRAPALDPVQDYRAYYCPGARKAVPPALRIISMPSSAVNRGVVLVALRCPRLTAANTAALALAASGAS